MTYREEDVKTGCVLGIMAAFVMFLVVAAVLLVRSANSGRCIGADDYLDLPKDKQTEYRLSTRNVILGAVLVETVVVPIYVALEASFCPKEATP